jgi:hypothetical protein
MIALVADPIPRVVLDTTAVVGSGFGRSGSFSHLLRDAADKRVEVIVPELVVKETVFVYRRRLFNLREALEELPQLARAGGSSWDLPQRPALVQRMEDELRSMLAAAGITPEAAPPVDGDAFAARMLERRKPTKPLASDPGGRELADQPEGFRDQLVWEHVRTAAEAGPVVFVTDNTRDFGVKKTRKDGRAELHSDLVADLDEDRRLGRSAGKVELVLDVETLVREYLQDEDALADMERHLEDGADGTASEAVRALVNRDGLGVDAFVPPVAVQGDIEEATLIELSGELSISLEDAYLESSEDEPREYGVTLVVTGLGTVDWVVTAPASWDLEAFAGVIEGDAAGGGFIQDVDTSPMEIRAYGRYRPSDGEWVALEVEPAEQDADEASQRRRAHDQAWFEMEQSLGLVPSDDEIEQHERDHATMPKPTPGTFRRRRRR